MQEPTMGREQGVEVGEDMQLKDLPNPFFFFFIEILLVFDCFPPSYEHVYLLENSSAVRLAQIAKDELQVAVCSRRTRSWPNRPWGWGVCSP
ncbi:hypothetical protein SLEP1_g21211 [Rubroshorea leprosula]|uniref:Uncharacterized protein n=1 Tax=Rubroshorea leprosula TaxID=152421 RepID=A0AAV5J8F1_9ROSI|nr:hypothetical protein SLEP1_g21211 [Rubroshorea leprosula]